VEHGLDPALLALFGGAVALWALFGRVLSRRAISAPMVFVAVGLLVANPPLSIVDVHISGSALRELTELTLALLLFSDAARVKLRALRHDAGVPVRLLAVGLPLTIGLGTLVGAALLPGIGVWAVMVIAAAVAPTDAALGLPVVEDERVPSRIRRILNVESGLNDGIATPFVTCAIAGAAAEFDGNVTAAVRTALVDLAIGVGVGIAVGLVLGRLVRVALDRGWTSPNLRGPAVVAFALLAFALAKVLDGNGFIAAFVGGLAFGATLPDESRDATLEFDSVTGEFASWAVWFLFGTVLVGVLDATTWQTVVVAVLALTLFRMLPVAIALVGTGLDRTTVAFVGWFGPRGLASVVFAILAADGLQGEVRATVVATIALTVVASVVAHGVSAAPLARRYGARAKALSGAAPEQQAVPDLTPRQVITRAER
jgi:sodium/hydrogen antiporter